jgi:hypothetical protein
MRFLPRLCERRTAKFAAQTSASTRTQVRSAAEQLHISCVRRAFIWIAGIILHRLRDSLRALIRTITNAIRLTLRAFAFCCPLPQPPKMAGAPSGAGAETPAPATPAVRIDFDFCEPQCRACPAGIRFQLAPRERLVVPSLRPRGGGGRGKGKREEGGKREEEGRERNAPRGAEKDASRELLRAIRCHCLASHSYPALAAPALLPVTPSYLTLLTP